MKERLARPGRVLLFLGVVHLLVVFAAFLAPYDYSRQHRELPLAPPTRVHFVDSEGRWHWRPFVLGDAGDSTGHRAGSRQYPIRFFVPGPRYELLGVFPSTLHLFGVEEPGHIFLFGTDSLGRDVFSRLLYGGWISLFFGIIAAGIALSLALLFGGLAGYYGGWPERLVMRGVDLFEALPWLYLLFAVRAFLPLDFPPAESFFVIIALVGILGWTRPARIVRGLVLVAREREFVLAARGFGASDSYLLRRHVLPQAIGAVLTQATLLIPLFILGEVTLSFLGLGVSEPVPSWGNMLGALLQFSVLMKAWWMFAPGLALVLVLVGYFRLSMALETRWRNIQV